MSIHWGEAIKVTPRLDDPIDPKPAWAFNDRGFAYYLKGDPDSAFAGTGDFRAAVD